MAQQCGTCHVLDGLTLRIPFGPVSVVCAPEVEILEFPKKVPILQIAKYRIMAKKLIN